MPLQETPKMTFMQAEYSLKLQMKQIFEEPAQFAIHNFEDIWTF